MILPNHFIFGGAKEVAWRGCIPKAFVGLAVAAICPRPQVSLAVHQNHSISPDPVSTISNRVSCCMLIIPTASIKPCFMICVVRFYYRAAHRRPCISAFFALCKKFIDVMCRRWLENSFLFQNQVLFSFWHLASMYSEFLVQGLRQLKAL